MIIGFYAKKKYIITEQVSKKLSEMLLRITSPLLVISSFQVNFTNEILNNAITVFIFAMAAHLASALLGKVLFLKCKVSQKKIMKFAAIYSNCGFMGFPLLESLFGKVGVLLGSVYVAAFNIFLWTNGVMIFNSDSKLNKASLSCSKNC